MTSPQEELRSVIRTRLLRAAATRDLGPLLEPDALRESQRLQAALGDDRPDLESAYLLGWFHWFRYRFGAGDDDLSTAVRMFAWCFAAGVGQIPVALAPALADEALSRIGILTGDAPGSNRSEYIPLYQTIIDRVAETLGADHPAYPEISRVISTEEPTVFESAGLSDLDASIRLAAQYIQPLSADDGRRGPALTYMNQALFARYLGSGLASDLDASIEAGRAAIGLPPASVRRRVTALDSLAAGLRARYERAGRLPDLAAAIETRRQAILLHAADESGREARMEELEELERWRSRYRPRLLVSTGFATVSSPFDTVEPGSTLLAGFSYWYWFDIGDAFAPDAIDRPEHREVPIGEQGTDIPLTVALFTFPGEIEAWSGKDVGEFIVPVGGRPRVSHQADPLETEATERGRLAFAVRMPDEPGRYRLRCNLYCRQTLLQSRLVEAEVTSEPQQTERALSSTVDFSVSTTLSDAVLDGIRPLRLSVLLNDNGNGTHGFRFMGENGLKGDSVLDGQLLQDLLDRARETYRRVAWDSKDEWDQTKDRYVYEGFPGKQRLCDDLIRLARAGYRMWSQVAVELSISLEAQLPPGQSPQLSLREFMRRGPGFVEFTCKKSARMVVPASILYDFPLDTNKDLRVCPDALAAIFPGADLAAHSCFTGACLSYDDDSVVCPGGFWGYRHGIGLPQSRGERPDGQPESGAADLADSQLEIRHTAKPEFIIGVADEFRGDHVSRILRYGDSQSHVENQRDRLLADLRSTRFAAHIVYFLCHGNVVNGIPALQVGPRDSAGITGDNIADGTMYWLPTHPLVFMNGCRTAAAEPKYALNLVDAFVRGAHASGVIGTEITVFESLAIGLADEFFRRFIDVDEPVAEALRRARLHMLAKGNPLGLVYIAYAAPRLQLIP